MSLGTTHRDRITDEASLWFVRAQDPDFSDDDRKNLASWLAGSAEHVREYLQLAALTSDLHELSATPSIDELIALARAAGDERNVVALTNRERATAPTRRKSGRPEANVPCSRIPGLRAAAASVLMAVAIGVWLYVTSGPVIYSTGVGEQVSFPLEDGSVVTLNAQSSLEIGYTDTERNVRLVAGEALFDVVKYADRPFRVVTERAVIRAVGTVFNVRQRGEGTTVTVVEGIVDVHSRGNGLLAPARGSPSSGPATGESGAASESSGPRALSADTVVPVRLGVGQQARVDRQSGQVAVVDVNIQKATSWRERRLVFEAWRLSDVVDEFNLYNDQRIVIQDARLAELVISGAFSADDRKSFALFLDEAGLAESRTRADGTIVLRAADAVQR